MIIGVDIGGTKTLVACFAENGTLLREIKFETNHNYETFLKDLTKHAQEVETSKGKVACIAVPGLLDREAGKLKSLGNLPWKDRYIAHDAAEALGISRTFIENDSKLAGLAEGRYLRKSKPYKRIYYMTISTGIGGALLIDGKLADQVIDGEIGMVPVEDDLKKIVRWEDIASGRAFFTKYGQKAADVEDPKVWEEFSKQIGFGVAMVCCIYQIDAIIFGGGLGQHLPKFKKYLKPYVSTYLHTTINQPKELAIVHYGDDSVIYGCYQYGKDKLS